ncbi:hypothetical protein [Roseimaritima sediminicola]|uniref:hypothetical protein n=1 Tax=Roseimaritima sediminicola TaxID=2662066 RepID=UPI001298499E|nr:hypothetical protein [Roseimaritima sediminicola]
MHKKLLPFIEDLEKAVEDEDTVAAKVALHRLNDETIYSGNEVYDRLHAIESKLTVVLLQGMKPSEFGKLISDNRHLFAYKVWEAIEGIHDRISVGTLWEIKDFMGFPSPNSCPKLHSMLAEADGEEISKQLIETIDRLASAEAAEGTNQSNHEKTMSAFRFVRWSPSDGGLSDCVRLLAMRPDNDAQLACRRYLMSLPWGAERQATLALLDGMVARPQTNNREIFKEALATHDGPASLRTWLWAAIGETSPDECLLGVIADLAAAEKDSDRNTFIAYLDSAMSQARQERISYPREAVASVAESVDTANWPRITRGYYGTLLNTHLPAADASRVSGRIERCAVSLARIWEVVRLDHMGCFIPLALMITMGWLAQFCLDKLLGKPDSGSWLPVAFFWAWIAWALVNVRTHFSGHETITGKAFAGLITTGSAAPVIKTTEPR